jgi:uncharacterized HhH-GPD family protein
VTVRLPDLRHPGGDVEFVLGVVLNQNIRAEIAWRGPATLRQRLGHLDPGRLARTPAAELQRALAAPPAVHPFAERMADFVRGSCGVLASRYGGSAAGLWADGPSLADLRRRFVALPGIGTHKAEVAAVLLSRHYGVRLADGPVDPAMAVALCPRLVVELPGLVPTR